MAASEELRERITGLERQLAELKGIRLLVGGLAHDFNNLLTAISGHAALIQAEEESGSESFESALAILKAAERATAIAGKLQNLARREQSNKVPVDLNATVAEVAALLAPTTGADIEIRQDLSTPVASTIADPDEIHQLVLNLVLNARESIPEGGRITLGTNLDEAHAVITVRDTGHGMDPKVRQRAFEPFFTTRPPREGTGLGLTVVASIVERHGGYVEVESEPGRGTAVRVYLPLAAKSVAQSTG